jgi:hypothetical protein
MVRNTSREYQRMSPEDQRRFDGWMKANGRHDMSCPGVPAGD